MMKQQIPLTTNSHLILCEKTVKLLLHCIELELKAIDSILSNSTIPDSSRIHTEASKNVLVAVKNKLHANETLQFNTVEKYHIRYAITLRVYNMVGTLFDDEIPSQDNFSYFLDEVILLLGTYEKLIE